MAISDPLLTIVELVGPACRFFSVPRVFVWFSICHKYVVVDELPAAAISEQIYFDSVYES